ncbi:elongin-B-like [Watersipora subatra]|uniref:elongin-B-like n=1 Tax=Watersipora subatra TaxID=2589382 RepID=UPI00355C6691
MDVFLMIRRKNCTIFTDAKETTSVAELKKMIEGITKVAPEDQLLFNWKQEPMDEKKNLQDNGYTPNTARAQCPAQINIAYRQSDGEFEPLDIVSYSPAPELPDVMKASQQEASHVSSGGEAQTA